MSRKQRHKAWLLGLGLDSTDKHKRLTKGENFILIGGSEATHDKMTEGAVKFNEKLQKNGKTLENIDQREFRDIARESGLIDDE